MNLEETTSTTTDVVLEIKEDIPTVTTFKNNLEVENFYRFVYDNDLRRECKVVLDRIFVGINSIKKKRKPRTKKLQ